MSSSHTSLTMRRATLRCRWREGGADVRFAILFVAVFLSLSLLAFALAFPGFSGREEEEEEAQQRRETSEKEVGQGHTSTNQMIRDRSVNQTIAVNQSVIHLIWQSSNQLTSSIKSMSHSFRQRLNGRSASENLNCHFEIQTFCYQYLPENTSVKTINNRTFSPLSDIRRPENKVSQVLM